MKMLLLPLPLVLSVLASSAFAQSGSHGTVLNCSIMDSYPVIPGRIDQGGFQFEYQSLQGMTDDYRACMIYQVRNMPDRPPTPLRWIVNNQLVVEKARLPRCGTDVSHCPWLTFAEYFDGQIAPGSSLLSFGLNADTYHEVTTVYSRQSPSTLGSDETPGLGGNAGVGHAGHSGSAGSGNGDHLEPVVETEIQGAFPTSDDDTAETITLHLRVRSRIEPSFEETFRVSYEIEDVSRSGVMDTGLIRFAWEAFTLADRYLSEWARPAEIAETANTITISFYADNVALMDQSRFSIYHGSSLREPVTIFKASAHVPF